MDALVLQAEARQIAIENNLDPYLFLGTISCESAWLPSARGDHGDSRGLVQISKYWYPEVSNKEADDPAFALDFMAKMWVAGHERYWTCYRLIQEGLYTPKGLGEYPIDQNEP